MAGNVAPTPSPYERGETWIAPAMWIAVALLVGPIVIGTVILLIPGSGSPGTAPAGYFILGMIVAVAVDVAVLAQLAAAKMRWTIHPGVATVALLGVFAVVAAGFEVAFTGVGLAFVTSAIMVLSGTVVVVGPRTARIPAGVLAATVFSVAVYVLVDL
jgi:hypothetical protein